MKIEIDAISFLGETFAFAGDTVFYLDNRSGKLQRITSFDDDDIVSVHQVEENLIFHTEFGLRYAFTFDPAQGLPFAEFQLLSE